LTATAPALIAEIVSPSSAKDDLGAKADEYLRLPSLSAYLVLSQEEPKARMWLRGAGGFSSEPEILDGHSAVIAIASLGIDLPLAEIYAGIEQA
jgi:Uma2 family endonuclease